jgi:hypothetical protein
MIIKILFGFIILVITIIIVLTIKNKNTQIKTMSGGRRKLKYYNNNDFLNKGIDIS